MRKIEVKREEIVTLYEAVDGTTFKNEEECMKYEQSAKGVLISKYLPLVVDVTTEYKLFGCGDDDYTVELVKIEESEDIDTVMQLWICCNPHLLEQDERITKMREVFKEAKYSNPNTVIISRDGFNAFWILDSSINIIKRLYPEYNA